MKIISLNIQKGGGKRCSAILDRLRHHDADVVVLSEFQNGANGDSLREGLLRLGYCSFHVADSECKGKNTVAIFSRQNFAVNTLTGLPCSEEFRIASVAFSELTLLAVYFAQKNLKEPLWKFLCDYAHKNMEVPQLVLGDFNTGNPEFDGGKFYCSEYFNKLGSVWTDCWRHFHGSKREYTWKSKKAEWRIDHAFVSPGLLPNLQACNYSHEERNSHPIVSDHSALICCFNVPFKVL